MLKALDSLRKGPRFLSQAGMSEGTSLGVLWLRNCLAMWRTCVQSLVRELRSHMPQGNLTCARQLEKVHRPQQRSSTVKKIEKGISSQISGYCCPRGNTHQAGRTQRWKGDWAPPPPATATATHVPRQGQLGLGSQALRSFWPGFSSHLQSWPAWGLE